MTEANDQPNPQVSENIPWLSATASDFENLDFEAPISESDIADASELAELFRKASESCAENTPPFRVFSMLSSITGMYFKSEDRNETFGPMFQGPNGRTAIPADFRGKIEILAGLVLKTKNPVLRARLADLCSSLDRKRGKLGLLALSAYSEIVDQVDAGKLKFRFDENSDPLSHHSRDLLRRALQLSRILGWDKAEAIKARELVIQFRLRAKNLFVPMPFYWFAKLDIEFGVSDACDVGQEIESFISAVAEKINTDTLADLWKLAARAYHYAKRADDNYRCRSEAAECLVRQATGVHKNSAMIASHDLSKAIAALHGIPGKKDRRTELRHLLIDVQSGIIDEMSSFSHQMDMKDVIEKLEKIFEKRDLREIFFTLAVFDRAPDPEALAKEAAESIRQHPLASIFGTSHHDSEGKVIYRTEGGGFGDGENDPAIRQQIAQSESIRRTFVVGSTFEVARRAIIENFYLSEDIFIRLLEHSPFIPPDLQFTFSRAFLRLFQGDYTSAVYTLTPLLENSLRYVLKNRGEDVSIFDDATQTQQDRTISSLFEQMRESLDEIFTKTITSDIERVFLSKPGPYLRHALAHGLLRDGDPHGPDAIYGCWLIFKLCLIPLLPYRDQISLPA